MTIKELQARAKELGIKGFSKMKKAELEELLAPKASIQPATEPLPFGSVALGDHAAPVPAAVFGDEHPAYIAGRPDFRTDDEKRKQRNAAKRKRRELRAQGYSVGFVA